jgi:hypothetical protein
MIAWRRATFEDFQQAAISGYVAGGLTPEAARTIVAAASQDIAALVTREMSPELRRSFLCACDLEAFHYANQHGYAMFTNGRDT